MTSITVISPDQLSRIPSDLTDWKNPPTLENLKADYEEAQSSHTAHTVEVDSWLSALNGDQEIKPKKGRSKIVPKLIRKQAEWRYSSLAEPFLSTEDVFNTYPVTAEDQDAAYQNGLVLNYQMNCMVNKTRFIDEYIRTSVDEGTVVVKVGWEYSDTEEEVEVPEYQVVAVQDPAQLQQFEQMQQMLQQDPEGYAKQVPPELQKAHQTFVQTQGGQQVQVGTHMKMQTKVLKNQPTLEVCDYSNIVIDPTCNGDIERAEFIIYSFETSMAQLKKDGRYKNLDKVNIESASVLSQPDHSISDSSNFKFRDEPRKKIVAYEYWGYWDIDGDGEVKPIVATWVGDTLIRMEENPFPDKELPFVLVQYLPRRKNIYGEPDGALLIDNQRIIGAVTRGMIDIIGRSANGQQGIRKDALDVVNARKFENGEDYKFNANVDPRQAFHMGTYPEIPRSAMEVLQMQNNEAESLTGVKAFNTGISGSALGNTATGIRSALDASSKRELGILRRLADGLIRIGRKIISMNQEFLQDDEIIRITSEEFVDIRRDDLAGKIDIKLNISTAEADEQRASELSFMLQTTANTLPFELTRMMMIEMAKLRKMPDLAKQIQQFKPEPDPLAQKKGQLEIALLEAQVNNEMAKTAENQADIELKKAKARGFHSKADLQDLDFVETESGVKRVHEKDMKDVDLASKMRQRDMNHAMTMETKDHDMQRSMQEMDYRRLQELDNKAFDQLNMPE